MAIKLKELRLWSLAFLCSALFLATEGQNANRTAGNSLLVQKTSFSCAGRPAGYYADVETGCQVYHMCDGIGRQFSYACPNTTLFQQRMLICDHWYMVNCSKAESNYAANLLIGQRDKPFVNDEENNLRTPRPDLLDRPYAPDYSGESFRSQYKQITPSQNQIRDDSSKSGNKLESPAGQTRWRIPPPSRTILPPAYEPQIELASSSAAPPLPPRPRVPISSTSTTSTTAATRRPVAFVPPVTPRTEALHLRRPIVIANELDDLGTSHSTRYNTSADFNSAELPAAETKNSTKLLKFVKTPSKIYEPPFVYPIYNLEDTQPAAETLRTSSAAPFSTAASTHRFAGFASSSTTARPISRPTTNAGAPFSYATLPTTVSSSTSSNQRVAATAALRPLEQRTPTPAQSFRLNRPVSSTTAAPKLQQQQQLPFNDLLPPFVEFVPHDIATTQGPPIYYEWKVPANGLEPPKLDAPIGVDGRDYPEGSSDYTNKPKPEAFNSRLNDISPVSVKRVPSLRSIKPNELPKAQRRADVASSSSTADITQLRKQLLIPEIVFPLETIGRTGYAAGASAAGDVYNSFQLKIPERRSSGSGSAKSGKWFGENPKCPECHPSFVQPGSCEPCLRR
ncbi:CG14880 [Drosophila busckii]|uniref:CG14880 n=3 Tax=Drosophila busckii TaxID=30019 RepID=A0A0M4EKK5_DROBS|nr:CG14880 [Drosophila busckii]